MGSPADLITVDAAEYTALLAIARAARDWADHRTGADPVLDAVRQNRAALDPDPGYRLAWPGVDYLPPAGDRWYLRDEPDADGEAHDRHTIGYSDTGRWYDEAGRAA